MKKATINNAPSSLVIFPSSINNTGREAVNSMYRLSCLTILLSIDMPLDNRTAIANMKVKLTTLLPMTLPRLKAGFLLMAALIPTKSSGSVVAKARIINPLVNSLSLKKEEIFERLLTIQMLVFPKTKANIVKNTISAKNAIVTFSPQTVLGLCCWLLI